MLWTGGGCGLFHELLISDRVAAPESKPPKLSEPFLSAVCEQGVLKCQCRRGEERRLLCHLEAIGTALDPNRQIRTVSVTCVYSDKHFIYVHNKHLLYRPMCGVLYACVR